jgi:predicted Zn-ribbon and HTH transcriptional regulator
MRKSLRILALLLLISATSFAQKAIVNTTKSNIKDRVVKTATAKGDDLCETCTRCSNCGWIVDSKNSLTKHNTSKCGTKDAKVTLEASKKNLKKNDQTLKKATVKQTMPETKDTKSN